MNLLSVVQEKFGFTRNETRTIAILAVTFLLGAALRSYRQHASQSEPIRYDYSRSDSIFLALSHRADSLDVEDDSSRQASAAPAEGLPLAPVNLNTATLGDLMRLPTIGTVYARRILDYRTQNGPFASVEGLLHVQGIGKKKLDRLRPYLTVKKN